MRETFVVNDILKNAISYRMQTIPGIACQLLSKKKYSVFFIPKNKEQQKADNNKSLPPRANKKKNKNLFFVFAFCCFVLLTALDNMSWASTSKNVIVRNNLPEY